LDAHGDPLPDGAVARLGSLRHRYPGPVSAAALSADGRRLALADDAAVRLIDVATGDEWRRFPHDCQTVTRLALSAAGRSLAAPGTSGAVRVWRTDVAGTPRELNTPRARNSSLSLSADGRLLALSREGVGDDCKASVWDVATGEQLGRFE